MDELVDEDIYEQVRKHEEQQEKELEEEQIIIEEPTTSPMQQNTQQYTTEQVVIEEPQPEDVIEEYEQFLESVDWMALQELKLACSARKLHCSGSKKELIKRLDNFNQKVEIAHTKPFIDRKRYKFHVTIHGEKCYRVISVPRDCALSFLVYTALRSLNFDTNQDFKMDVVNHPEIDCVPEALVHELELVDGDVLQVVYDSWLISLMLMYNDVLDRREGTALLKVSGEAPKQIDQPDTKQRFPKQGKKRTKKQGKFSKKKKQKVN
jgi:hypothetical protein